MADASWLRHWHDRRRLWAVLALMAALAIAFSSLTPGSEMPEGLPWDKFNHFVGYGGLAGLVGLAGMRLRAAFASVALYGIVIEYAQMLVPERSGGDGWDILANALGAGCALLLLHGLRKGFIRGRS